MVFLRNREDARLNALSIETILTKEVVCGGCVKLGIYANTRHPSEYWFAYLWEDEWRDEFPNIPLSWFRENLCMIANLFTHALSTCHDGIFSSQAMFLESIRQLIKAEKA